MKIKRQQPELLNVCFLERDKSSKTKFLDFDAVSFCSFFILAHELTFLNWRACVHTSVHRQGENINLLK